MEKIINHQCWMIRCMLYLSLFLSGPLNMSVLLFPHLGNKNIKVSILIVAKIVHTNIIQMYYKL